MATTLASLIVSLECSTSRFEQGMNLAAQVGDRTMGALSSAANTAKAAIAGIASGLTINAFSSMVKGSIDVADSLDKMAQKTGIAVETLGGLGYAAEMSGTSLEGVATGTKNLVKNMADAAGGGKETSAVFKAMGIDVVNTDGSLRAADETLLALADRFAGWEDGPEKSALALKVFGKAGEEMVPLLNQGSAALREQFGDYKQYGGFVGDATARSAQFNDTLSKLHLMQGALGREITVALLPTLQAIADVLVAAKTKGEGFASVGEIIATALKGVAIIGISVVETFKSIGQGLGAIAAVAARLLAGDFKGAIEIGKSAIADIKTGWADAATNMATVWSASTATIAAKTETNIGGKTKAPIVSVKEATKDWKDELYKLLATLENNEKGVSEEYWKRLKLLQKAYEEGEIDLGRYRNGVEQLTISTNFGKAAIKEYEEAQKAAVKADQDGYDWMVKLRDAYDKSVKSANDLIEKLQFETSALTMTNAERQVAIALRELESKGIAKGTEEYNNYAAAITAAVEKKEGMQAQIDMWTSIEAAAHTTFSNILEGGTSVFDKLRDSLKAGLYDLLYQLTVKRWIISIAADVTGNPAILGGLSSGGGLVETIANAISGGGAGDILGKIGGVFGIGGSGLQIGDALSNIGTIIPTLLETGSFSAAFAGMGASFAAVAPWAALAAIAVPLVMKWFDDGDATRTASFGSGSGLRSGNPLFQSSSAFGKFGLFNDSWFSDEMAKQIGPLLDTIKSLDNALSAAVGPEKTQAIANALAASTKSFDFGLEHTDLNATGVAGSIIKDRYATALGALSANLGVAVTKFEGTGEALGKFVITLATLDSATQNLPARIRDITIALQDGTQETADKMLAFATAYATVQDIMNRDPLADAFDAVALASQSSWEALQKQGDALAELAAKYDGSTEASQQLTAATSDYYASVVQMIAGIMQAKDAISELFTSSQDFYRMSGLTDTEKYLYLQEQTAALTAQLANTLDPAKISSLAGKIDENQRAMFGLLDTAGQADFRQIFIDAAENTKQISQDQLDKANQAAQAREESLVTAVRGAFDEAAEKFLEAAGITLEAARTPTQVDVGVAFTANIPGEAQVFQS